MHADDEDGGEDEHDEVSSADGDVGSDDDEEEEEDEDEGMGGGDEVNRLNVLSDAAHEAETSPMAIDHTAVSILLYLV